jgi:Protein of unknown function (DUF3618)
VTSSQQPGDAKQLREEIERTREHLGETVEQLAAKVDVKGRAQARAAALAGQVTRQARAAVAQGREQAAQAREQGSRAARKHQVPLSAAVAAGLLAAVAVIIWQRSKR